MQTIKPWFKAEVIGMKEIPLSIQIGIGDDDETIDRDSRTFCRETNFLINKNEKSLSFSKST